MLQPVLLLVSVKLEFEVAELGSWVNPHLGRFSWGAAQAYVDEASSSPGECSRSTHNPQVLRLRAAAGWKTQQRMGVRKFGGVWAQNVPTHFRPRRGVQNTENAENALTCCIGEPQMAVTPTGGLKNVALTIDNY